MTGQSLFLLDSSNSLEVQNDMESGEWSIKFNSTQDSQLDVEVLNGSSKLDFDRVEYEVSGSWIELSPSSVNGDNVTADWSGSTNSLGRVVFDINEFGRYKANLSLGGDEITVYNPGKRVQRGTEFDVLSPTIQYTLCSFNSNFWRCNAQTPEPGSDGEVINLENSKTRKFNIPSNSDITDFSVNLSTVEDQSLLNLTGEGVLFSNIDDTSNPEVLTFDDQTVKAYDSSGESF